ncbi:MAG: TIGR03619 family F420-dependent LLM class oxidoreductase [Novosphingobium sp.]|nr:TIGR03619 family F420-dependent LLM class oxidoreductase [Novosphingobium sp.]MCP5403911.1 TIGR03619 family F420-dependent LLM class oxidoreductase [Novosphingobium sp.]
MKTSLYIPLHLVLDDLSKTGDSLAAIGRAAEDAGFDACNLTDHPAPTAKWRHSGGHDALDPFAALCFIAAATRRIRLHTHIVVLPYRNPFVTAKCITTLDVVSNGRAIIGVGAGYMKGEYFALGMDYDTRGPAMDEALTVMKQAWSGEPVSYEGRAFSARDILPTPVPVRKPHPTLWGGGNSKSAIRRAAEHCDGFSPFYAAPAQAARNKTVPLETLADLREKIALYRDELERFGRTGDFDICSGPSESLEACDAASKQLLLDQAGEMAGMGVNWMLAGVPGETLEEFLDAIAWFGAEVRPELPG